MQCDTVLVVKIVNIIISGNLCFDTYCITVR